MRKLVAAIAVFAPAALIAAYVALAPLAGSGPETLQGPLGIFDQSAERISEPVGRDMAILALLAVGAVLGMIGGLLAGGGRPRQGDDGTAMPGPGPVWRPEPFSSEHRIASLRRRAGTEVSQPAQAGPASEDNADTEQFAGADVQPQLLCPLVLARKVRMRGDEWTESRSWLGGLPRLSGAEWPRDEHGLPLPFAAQIDLAEIAELCPHDPLPREGSLAFFLGSGAVLAVAPDAHDFTAPPAGLPPAFEEGGAPFPVTRSRLSRDFFPFWPVEPVALAIPEEALAQGTIESAVHDMVRGRFGEPSLILAVGGDSPLWWYGVFHLADRMHEAMDSADRVIADERQLEQKAEVALAELDTRDEALPGAVAGARRKLHDIRARLQAIEEEAAALPAMVGALDDFVADREPWDPLIAEERDLVVDILAEIHLRHGRLVQHALPHALAPLQALCIRVMASGEPKAFSALSDEMRALVGEHRVPSGPQHQIFDGDAQDLLLLQLGYDDMMEWRWKSPGVFQFRISAQDAAAAKWDRARLTFVEG
ncbi:MAG TPA: DUF1963 domain-containing protein [Novosphingobium sp.]|nr:DUF1963 domain-containing protein [Novosphingobium sp.]